MYSVLPRYWIGANESGLVFRGRDIDLLFGNPFYVSMSMYAVGTPKETKILHLYLQNPVCQNQKKKKGQLGVQKAVRHRSDVFWLVLFLLLLFLFFLGVFVSWFWYREFWRSIIYYVHLRSLFSLICSNSSKKNKPFRSVAFGDRRCILDFPFLLTASSVHE